MIKNQKIIVLKCLTKSGLPKIYNKISKNDWSKKDGRIVSRVLTNRIKINGKDKNNLINKT